ncbi:Collagen triple helix repeat [Penicillium roqueforti FM164]|uniref:Collagen triple helix repeat n=1 Tax=Penicillium roqueforti (strain FM164) TaxID=1365484 RepID=W6PPZ8_PENRF|nr:Collagen triple helix repeat [Penicillium roqueforti FM164]
MSVFRRRSLLNRTPPPLPERPDQQSHTASIGALVGVAIAVANALGWCLYCRQRLRGPRKGEGLPGSDGPRGIPGPPGPKGSPGDQEPIGSTGNIGQDGTPGLRGFPGIQGGAVCNNQWRPDLRILFLITSLPLF